VQGYETASKRAFVISIAFGLMSQPIKFRFSSLQTTAVVPLFNIVIIYFNYQIFKFILT